MMAVRHLGFLKISFFETVSTVQFSGSICAIMQNFIWISQTVAEILRFFDFWRPSTILDLLCMFGPPTTSSWWYLSLCKIWLELIQYSFDNMQVLIPYLTCLPWKCLFTTQMEVSGSNYVVTHRPICFLDAKDRGYKQLRTRVVQHITNRKWQMTYSFSIVARLWVTFRVIHLLQVDKILTDRKRRAVPLHDSWASW